MQFSAQLLWAECDALLELRNKAEKALGAEAKRHRITRVLQSCPGLREGLREVAEMLLLTYQDRLGSVPAPVRQAVLAIEDAARLRALLPTFLRGTAAEIEQALRAQPG